MDHNVAPAGEGRELGPVVSLRLPWSAELDGLVRLVTRGVASAHSQRAYHKALTDFLEWWRQLPERLPFSKALVQNYTGVLRERRLAPSSINVRLAASASSPPKRRIPGYTHRSWPPVSLGSQGPNA